MPRQHHLWCLPAGKVYHLAEAGALSAAVTPVKPDGSPDADVLARLAVRHDDSLENVANRLTLWDRQVSWYPWAPIAVWQHELQDTFWLYAHMVLLYQQKLTFVLAACMHKILV